MKILATVPPHFTDPNVRHVSVPSSLIVKQEVGATGHWSRVQSGSLSTDLHYRVCLLPCVIWVVAFAALPPAKAQFIPCLKQLTNSTCRHFLSRIFSRMPIGSAVIPSLAWHQLCRLLFPEAYNNARLTATSDISNFCGLIDRALFVPKIDWFNS